MTDNPAAARIALHEAMALESTCPPALERIVNLAATCTGARERSATRSSVTRAATGSAATGAATLIGATSAGAASATTGAAGSTAGAGSYTASVCSAIWSHVNRRSTVRRPFSPSHRARSKLPKSVLMPHATDSTYG